MLIIDQNTDVVLAHTLEKIKAQEQHYRCIYFNLKTQKTAEHEVQQIAFMADLRGKVIVAAQRSIASSDMQVFLCGDGDIFILAPMIPSKEGREYIVEIATHLGRPAHEEWVSFVELPLHINRLLVEVEEKLEKRRKAESEKRRQAEQLQAERKRQAILHGAEGKQQEIHDKREGRSTPELMIVEDDVFSRRLVENVLQKKYPLTGLGEATYALETYVRIAPDVLFLDIQLPDVTGHELLERIIALDPEAYVVMLSGNCDRENITQAMHKGAKGFVAKPFTKDKLFQYIERCPTIKH